MLKTIVITATLTLSLVSLAAGAFLQLAGWTVVPVAQLAGLRAAQATLGKVQDTLRNKQANMARKTVKRGGKRLATSTISALTGGTLLVAGVTTAALLEEHCEDLQELHALQALAQDTHVDFTMQACLEDSQQLVSQWGQEALQYGQARFHDIPGTARGYWEQFKQHLPHWPWFARPG